VTGDAEQVRPDSAFTTTRRKRHAPEAGRWASTK
jgi:hypothetical protein